MTRHLSKKASGWLGLCTIGMGLLPLITGAEPAPGTPMWVVYAACSVFILGGLAVIFPRFGFIVGPAIILLFAMISTWVGFSPDEKQCTSTFSFGFSDHTRLSGCGIFKLSAILMWVIFLGGTVSVLKKKFKWK